MNHQALIATFYAYKGGTGRTLALANIARILSEERGYRVGLIDLDIDSPGLVHEPLCQALEHVTRNNALLDSVDECPGFVELFLRTHSGQPLTEATIDAHVCALPTAGTGNILLMPAARRSVTKTDVFMKAVGSFMSTIAFSDPSDDRAATVTWDILNVFAERYQLDFLFLDGRTGAGPFSPVYIYSVPHLLVLFFGLNEQNVRGSFSVLQAQADNAQANVPVILVASPVPNVGPSELEQRLAFIAQELTVAQGHRGAGAVTNRVYKLPTRVEHFLPYSDAAAFSEVYFPGAYPHSALADAYRGLASQIEALVIGDTEPNVEPAFGHEPGTVSIIGEQPLRIALENVHYDLLSKEVDAGDASSFGCHIEPYAAEDASAPWMRAAEISTFHNTLDDFESMPDVLVVPQSRLRELYSLHGSSLFEEVPLGEHSASRGLTFDFLDRYYPHWRGRCAIDGNVIALPFSANATIMAANVENLRPFCNTYWKQRNQRPLDPLFVPSSWAGLNAFLRANYLGPSSIDSLFRMVVDGPGCYYEWLNLVTSFGGHDCVRSAGDLESFGLLTEETLQATELFLALDAICGHSSTMTEQIEAFSSGNLALYAGWTDSFRFSRDDMGRVLAVHPTRLPQDSGEQSPFEIALAPIPRNMRYERSCIVDGWLMTFPKTVTRESEGVRGRAFAEWFLDPERQRRLLRSGFPTASEWAIDRELEAHEVERTAYSRALSPVHLGGGRRAEHSFEVFLRTMKTAVSGGFWVASPRGRFYQRIVEVLRKARSNPSADLRDLMGRVPTTEHRSGSEHAPSS